jgi:hypothetical protein
MRLEHMKKTFDLIDRHLSGNKLLIDIAGRINLWRTLNTSGAMIADSETMDIAAQTQRQNDPQMIELTKSITMLGYLENLHDEAKTLERLLFDKTWKSLVDLYPQDESSSRRTGMRSAVHLNVTTLTLAYLSEYAEEQSQSLHQTCGKMASSCERTGHRISFDPTRYQ